MWDQLSIEQWLILVTILMAVIYISATSIKMSGYKKKIKSLNVEKKDFLMTKPPMTYEECKDILDTCIGNVLTDLELRYMLNDVKYIRNIEKETAENSKEVLKLVSENVLEQMQCYVSRTYISQYISRNMRAFLISYLKEKNKRV